MARGELPSAGAGVGGRAGARILRQIQLPKCAFFSHQAILNTDAEIVLLSRVQGRQVPGFPPPPLKSF